MAERHDAEGYWLAEAGTIAAAPPLRGERETDVVIVGGGYTGLWTAWHLRRLEPTARIIVLEADRCGHGPSGRNGGFVNGLWFSLPALRERFGDRRAIATARAAQASVEAVGHFCREQGIDAWYRQGGYMQASTAPAWDGACDRVARACEELGEPRACQPLSPGEVAMRCASPVFRAGALYPGAATVQPARLALGLAGAVRASGTEVFDHTRVLAMARRGDEMVVDVDGGRVHARSVVLACGGALAGFRGMRHRLTLTSSHIVITEPVPDVLAELNWTGGECVTDARAMINYFRTTPDGRIAFGWGGGKVVYGARTHGRAERDPELIAEVERHLHRFFPMLAGRRIEHAWGGPIDASPRHLPVVDTLPGGRAHVAFGYTGNGVGPSELCGRILARLALDERDAVTRLPLVAGGWGPIRALPPEPLRVLGGELVRRSLERKEHAEERGRTPLTFDRLVARLPDLLGVQIGR